MAEESENATSEQSNTMPSGQDSGNERPAPNRSFSRENIWKRKKILLAILVVVLAMGGDYFLVEINFLGKHR